jgi:hypothetical protein
MTSEEYATCPTCQGFATSHPLRFQLMTAAAARYFAISPLQAGVTFLRQYHKDGHLSLAEGAKRARRAYPGMEDQVRATFRDMGFPL